jgi:IS5 family transposase
MFTLLEQADSEREKEDFALVCLLDVEDDGIRDLHLCCRHASHCNVIDCRDKLKKKIEEKFTNQKTA